MCGVWSVVCGGRGGEEGGGRGREKGQRRRGGGGIRIVLFVLSERGAVTS